MFYLYHNVPEFIPAFMTEDVLTALVGTLFPTVSSGGEESTAGSLDEDEADDAQSPTAGDAKPIVMRRGASQDSPSSSSLSSHPAKRNIMNFMRVIIVDSLSLEVSQKTSPAIDLLLDANPSGTTSAQQSRFQTELLAILMDHLLAADVLIGDGAALPVVPGGNVTHIAPNVFYLASRLVDKLWQGVFTRDPDEVFQFTLRLISQAKRRSGSTGSLSLEGIYRCLNRTILYMLSRPHSTAAQQQLSGTLEVLHKLTTNRSIVFGAGNHELDFFACLTFCLLQITSGQAIPTAKEDSESRTQWHVRPVEDASSGATEEDEEKDAAASLQRRNLLKNAAKRVWEELYVSKRYALEEAFKTSFGTANSTPDLESVRDQISEQAGKSWHTYVDLERRAMYSKMQAWEFHTQLESRIQRTLGGISGGLKRLTSVAGVVSSNSDESSKPKKEEPKVNYSRMPRAVVEQATLNHISIVKEVVEQHYRNRSQTDEHMLDYMEEQWLATEASLTQERGLWGPFNENPLTKWQVDLTEGPARMRKRLVRNDLFYLLYPHREDKGEAVGEAGDSGGMEVHNKPHKYRRPMSRDSKMWFKQHRHQLSMFEREQKVVEEPDYDDCDITVNGNSGGNNKSNSSSNSSINSDSNSNSNNSTKHQQQQQQQQQQKQQRQTATATATATKKVPGYHPKPSSKHCSPQKHNALYENTVSRCACSRCFSLKSRIHSCMPTWLILPVVLPKALFSALQPRKTQRIV